MTEALDGTNAKASNQGNEDSESACQNN